MYIITSNWIAVFLSILITKTYAVRTTIFNCDFNAGLSVECSFLPSSGSNLNISSGFLPDLTSPQQPEQPLSDATSITNSINGYICNLPYQINNWDMHFCLRQDDTNNYTCPTDVSNTSVCASGKYGYVAINSSETFDRTYSTIVRKNTAIEQCLTFYYYFTNALRNPMIEVLWQSLMPYSDASINIITVIPQSDNRWYKSETVFITNSSDYLLKFQLHRDSGSDSADFFFALDDMLITSGLCEPDLQNVTAFTIDQTSIRSTDSASFIESFSTSFPTDIEQSTLFSHPSPSDLIDTSQQAHQENTTFDDLSSDSDNTTVVPTFITTDTDVKENTSSSSTQSSNIDQHYSIETTITTKFPLDLNTIFSTSKQDETFNVPISTTVQPNIPLSTIHIELTTPQTTMNFSTSSLTSSTSSSSDNKSPKSYTILIIGLSVGLILPIAILSTIGFVYYFKYHRPMSRRAHSRTRSRTRSRSHTNRTITFNDD